MSMAFSVVFSLIKKTKIAIEQIVKIGALIVTKILGIPLKGKTAIGSNVSNNQSRRFI